MPSICVRFVGLALKRALPEPSSPLCADPSTNLRSPRPRSPRAEAVVSAAPGTCAASEAPGLLAASGGARPPGHDGPAFAQVRRAGLSQEPASSPPRVQSRPCAWTSVLPRRTNCPIAWRAMHWMARGAHRLACPGQKLYESRLLYAGRAYICSDGQPTLRSRSCLLSPRTFGALDVRERQELAHRTVILREDIEGIRG
jgi:hypothetical protein